LKSISNETFSANRSLFCVRFPELSSLLGLDSDVRTGLLLEAIPESYIIEESRSSSPTLRVGGRYVHSQYNPLRDAERALQEDGLFKGEACLFCGCGLAYLPELYARKFPESTMILAEPDIFLFLLCLSSRPLKGLLSHPGLILVIGTRPGEIISLLEKLYLTDISVYESPAITAPNQSWFDDFASLRKRNREKREINANTLKRFGDLWLGNMCKNLGEMREREGIRHFSGLFADIPILVLAAGPSLDRILPHLALLRKHCVIIAVDTAVRACLRSGVEPDFIMLVDPQYWNYRHLDGIECPSSILITESAAWPAVFRFKCRSIHLCSSLFPLGKFLESRTGEKGELGAGGSVSTTAWDFARHLGGTKIFMAGLDLGYPDKKTHFTGSIFEERSHTASDRLAPAETQGYLALYGAGPYPVPDYKGGTVLTDKRLILYAWWFESRLAAHEGHKTATLTPEGVRIPGFAVAALEDLTAGDEVRHIIDGRLAGVSYTAEEAEKKKTREKFDLAVMELKRELSQINRLASEAAALCESGPTSENDRRYPAIVRKLDGIDAKISANTAKEIASMVFPASRETVRDGTVLEASLSLYRDIRAAAKKNLQALEKFI
jgi:hypothetical protein